MSQKEKNKTPPELDDQLEEAAAKEAAEEPAEAEAGATDPLMDELEALKTRRPGRRRNISGWRRSTTTSASGLPRRRRPSGTTPRRTPRWHSSRCTTIWNGP